MVAGLPIVCSSIRGNNDLIEHGFNGFLHSPNDVEGYKNSIETLMTNNILRELMGKRNKEIILNFSEEKSKR